MSFVCGLYSVVAGTNKTFQKQQVQHSGKRLFNNYSQSEVNALLAVPPVFADDESTAALNVRQVCQPVPRGEVGGAGRVSATQQPPQRRRRAAAACLRISPTQHHRIHRCLGQYSILLGISICLALSLVIYGYETIVLFVIYHLILI